MANEADIRKFFNIPSFKDYQLKAINSLLGGRDCFVAQPTGSGKSIIFQSLPFFGGEVKESSNSEHIYIEAKSCVLVVCPLVSLMKDQVTSLQKKNASAIVLSNDIKNEDLQDVQGGKYNLVYASPETMLQKHRKILRGTEFGRRLIAIAIDESHCVKKWGTNGGAEPFRECYCQLAELRSLTTKELPVVALTATATVSIQKFIIENLSLSNPLILSKSPEKANIKYFVIDTKIDDINIIFKNVLANLISKKYKCERVLIFCTKQKHVSQIFRYIHHALKDKYADYATRPYAMFHAETCEKIKDYVVNSLADPLGKIRVLVSTIAFGMGVDCKGLHYVVHYGPPATMEDYFQESGRAGRDGQQSYALLIKYKNCMRSKHLSKEMKQYITSNNVCRRKKLMSVFSHSDDLSVTSPIHSCCDFCAKACECSTPEKCLILGVPDLFVHLATTEVIPECENHNICYLSDEGKKVLHVKLSTFRNEEIMKVESRTLCGSEVTVGFPPKAIDEVVTLANSNLDFSILNQKTCLISKEIMEKVLIIVKETLEQYADGTGNEIDEDSNSSSGSEIDFSCSMKYRAQIISDSE